MSVNAKLADRYLKNFKVATYMSDFLVAASRLGAGGRCLAGGSRGRKHVGRTSYDRKIDAQKGNLYFASY